MELVGIENSVITRLFSTTRPEGSPYLPNAVAAFVDRYKFVESPTTIAQMTAERVSFKHGLYEGAAFNLDVFSDGIIVGSKSQSSLLDSIVSDITDWMEKGVGLKKIETHEIRKSYESYLVVRSEARLLRALDAMKKIGAQVGASLKAASGRTVDFQPIGWALSPDVTDIAQMRPIPFRVERRAGVSFSTNFYYSCAQASNAGSHESPGGVGAVQPILNACSTERARPLWLPRHALWVSFWQPAPFRPSIPPRRPRLTAAGPLPCSSGVGSRSSISPVAMSTIILARWAKSRGRFLRDALSVMHGELGCVALPSQDRSEFKLTHYRSIRSRLLCNIAIGTSPTAPVASNRCSSPLMQTIARSHSSGLLHNSFLASTPSRRA